MLLSATFKYSSRLSLPKFSSRSAKQDLHSCSAKTDVRYVSGVFATVAKKYEGLDACFLVLHGFFCSATRLNGVMEHLDVVSVASRQDC